jgi:hypothetical protein
VSINDLQDVVKNCTRDINDYKEEYRAPNTDSRRKLVLKEYIQETRKSLNKTLDLLKVVLTPTRSNTLPSKLK